MKLTNYLPVSRELQKHWIYKDSDYLHCWMDMLFNARFGKEPKTDMYKGVLYTIHRGQFLYSRPTYSDRLKITEGKLRTLIKLLISDGMIQEVKSLGNNKPTIYKICNYETYNSQPSEDVDFTGVDGKANQVETKSQPSDNQVGTNRQPLKNNGNKETKKKDSVYTDDFLQIYSMFNKQAAKADAFKNYNKLLKQYTHEQLLDCVKAYHRTDQSKGQYAYQPNNFFGEKSYFKEYLKEAKDETLDDVGVPNWFSYTATEKNITEHAYKQARLYAYRVYVRGLNGD